GLQKVLNAVRVLAPVRSNGVQLAVSRRTGPPLDTCRPARWRGAMKDSAPKRPRQGGGAPLMAGPAVKCPRRDAAGARSSKGTERRARPRSGSAQWSPSWRYRAEQALLWTLAARPDGGAR